MNLISDLVKISVDEIKKIDEKLESLTQRVDPALAYAGVDGAHFSKCGDSTCSGTCDGGCSASCSAWD